MSKKKSEQQQLEALTRPQLIALATQKKAMTYKEALARSREELVGALINIKGVLEAFSTALAATCSREDYKEDPE